MAIFQVDNVKLHQAQIVKEWFGRKKNIDQKWMHLLIEINVVMVFSSRVASVFVQGLVYARVNSKSTPAHPKDFP